MDATDRTLALVLAGGEGSRLDVLTDQRAKPAMPLAGTYRLIDVPLTHCRHSRIADVWVVEQYRPHRLTDHLSNGRPWDLDRTRGGLLVLHPHEGSEGEGFHQGTGDAVHKLMPFIDEADPEYLLVLSSDHLYRLDYRDVLEGHAEAGADLTIVTTQLSEQDPSRFGVVETDGDRVTSFVRKPDEPATDVVSTEVFCFTTASLREALEAVAGGRDAKDDPLEDLGDDLIPWLVEHTHVREHRLDGYWRDLGTVSGYLQVHLDLLADEPPIALDGRDWPFLTSPSAGPGALVTESGRAERSRLSPGAIVRGTVRRCHVGRGVVVEEGAVVEDSVLLDRARIEAGATVRTAIVDEDAVVGEGATVGGPHDELTDEAVTIIGAGVQVDAGSEVAVGERLAPDD